MSISGYKAALSNLGTSLAGASERASLQILTDARNARDSGKNPFLEHDRIREIRKLPPEETFDLVTDSHHYIANGVVVHNCDIRINNDLEKQGFTFEGIQPWKDHSYPEDMPEEDIYDILLSNNVKPPPCDMANDLDEDADPSEEGRIQQLQAVSRAKQQASMIGGSVPGDVEKLLKEFLDPVIRWEVQLQNFFTELIVDDFSWRKPSRRHQEIYLPSLVADESRLEHLEYYVDISGSISDDMIIRFNSELKYIKDTLNPQRLSVIMFDTQICDVFEFTESDSFDKIKVVGGGGTSLAPVRERINTSRPTAAVIFTDLCCHPMAPLDYPVPIIWVVVGNPHATVPFGTAIHIKE